MLKSVSPIDKAVCFTSLPKHVAIVMDGNGRWAKSHMLPRAEGHRAGVKSLREIVEESRRLGIRYLTLFTFSTENWQRPKEEVSALMCLFQCYLESELALLLRNKIRLRVIGDLEKLPKGVRNILERNIKETESLEGMDLVLAISYGGRDEIVNACRSIAKQVEQGQLKAADIGEQTLVNSLYAPDIPDPDLLIRTSDENRISNFLLWQLAYSEIVVTPVLWPDFNREVYWDCLKEYAGRTRRFGLTDEQISKVSA